MLGKNVTVAGAVRCFRKELQCLYARRSAIDALIHSLEDYDRCRSKRLERQARRTPARHLKIA